jgi:SAM-dependent methyltransferase
MCAKPKQWDELYATNKEKWLADHPRQILIDAADLLPKSGIALDAACGVGNSSLYLAQRGMKVIAMDISLVALQILRERVLAQDLVIFPVAFDLSIPYLPPDYFDVILNFHFLERATIPIYKSALKPGGLVLFETFYRLNDQIKEKDKYLEPGELASAFIEFEMIRYLESCLPDDVETGRGMAQLIARKPSSK